MRNIVLWMIIIFTAAAGTGICGDSASQTVPAMGEEQLKEFIKQTIRENPKLIYDVLVEYQKELRAEKEQRELASAFRNRLSDTLDPHTPVKGRPDAPVTIIEYSDFECRYCARAASTMHALMKKYPGKIRVAFKHNPLKFHENAFDAACAALAAGRQGKFWEYHDLLFQHFDSLNEDKMIELAASLKLDMEKFNQDRTSQEISDQVTSDQEDAEALDISSAPSFLFNGVKLSGAKGLGYFSGIIERLLAETKAGTNGSQ